MGKREWLDQTRRDLHYALRSLRRTPAFTAIAVAILAIGIGMSTAMFTIFEAVILRRLPVLEQDRIAIMWPYRIKGAEISPPAADLAEVARGSRTMSGVAGIAHWQTAPDYFVRGAETISLMKAPVTANFFDVLAARPALGRFPRAENGIPGATRDLVLSHRAWMSRFNGDSSIIGQTMYGPYVREPYTIVGVAPEGLDYPVGTDCWVPLLKSDSSLRVFAVARLAPNASLDAANSEYFSTISRLEPGFRLTGSSVRSLTTATVGDVRPIIAVLLSAVALLLMIACVNVGNLFLVRATSRARELTVRRALGASGRAIVAQLLTESAIIAIGGGALGALCAVGLLRTLVHFAPSQLPRLDEVALHGSVLGAAIGVTALSVFLFGLSPALLGARVDPAAALRHDGRSGLETRQRRRLRDFLVSAQVALALIVLAGAGLLVRSLWLMEQLDLGYRGARLSIMNVAYDPKTLLSADTNLVARQANDIVVDETFERTMLEIPGVTAVTPVMTGPFMGTGINAGVFEAEGQTADDIARNPAMPTEFAGPQYFDTFDMRILRGRGFTAADRVGAPPVVVISESVARRLWPGTDALGKRVRFAATGAMSAQDQKEQITWRTVVGIVGDTHLRVFRESSPTVYLPWRQVPGRVWGDFAIRTSIAQPSLARDVRSALNRMGGGYRLLTLQSLDDLRAGPMAQPRLSALLLSGFGIVALLLAAFGLYGVVSSTVREQTREIGIRVALGATPELIARVVVENALRVAGVGAAVGLACALVGVRLLRSQLFEVSPFDPVSLVTVVVVLLGVALAAAYLPARRASRIDPIAALRGD